MQDITDICSGRLLSVVLQHRMPLCLMLDVDISLGVVLAVFSTAAGDMRSPSQQD